MSDLPSNPYVGPRPFSEAERSLFFGRELEAAALLERVLAERLLLFYAESGAGKSSLLHTRLIPDLRDEKGFRILPIGRISSELPPSVSTVENLFVFNLLLNLDQGDAPARLADVTLTDFLARLNYYDEHWVYDAAATPNSPSMPGQASEPRILIIDQFEEIFISYPERQVERSAFFHQLDQAIRDASNLRVVLTLREEYVAALEPYARLLADHLRARFYMEHMGVPAALEAVRQPAAMAGRPFAPGVAEQLVDNLRQVSVPGQEAPVPGQYVEPAQLQVVCYQLWNKLSSDPGFQSITSQAIEKVGNVDNILASFYENTIAAVLSDPSLHVTEAQLRDWFDHQLITEAGTRSAVLQREETTGGLANDVVQRLATNCLIRSDFRVGGIWIELVNDRLVDPIQRSNSAWRHMHQTSNVDSNAKSYTYDVFLAYNSADVTDVEYLVERLRQDGLSPFFDKWYLVPGEPLQEALEQALIKSASVAVFIGPSGVSAWQNMEIRTAIAHHVSTHDGYRVIPVLLPGVTMPRQSELPSILRLYEPVKFQGLDDAKAFKFLVAGIRGIAPIDVPPSVSSSPKNTNTLKSKWSILVYIAADNSLAEAGKTILTQLIELGSTTEVRLAVLYDGPEGARRCIVSAPGKTTLNNSLGKFDSGSSDALYETAKWTFEYCPAECYGLVLWGHGAPELSELDSKSLDEHAGPSSLSDDGTGHSVDILELEQALQRIQEVTGKPLDLLLHDTGYQATIEGAYQLRSCVEYMVASEDAESADGFPLRTILAALQDTPDLSAREVAALCVQQYAEYYEQQKASLPITAVALDLSRIDGLVRVVDLLASTLLGSGAGWEERLWHAQRSARRVWQNGFIDLRSLVQELAKQYVKNSDVQFAIQAVEEAFGPAGPVVLHRFVGNAQLKDIGGVIIYLPPPGLGKVSPYYSSLQFAQATQWGRLVEGYNTPRDVERWAIIVGISLYQHERLNLQFAARDAEELYQLLQTSSGGGFKADRMIKLVNEEATTANVQRALSSFLKKPAREDVVLLYFVCHGAPDPDRPSTVYLLTYDTDPDDISGTALPMREIQLSLKEILLAERVVIIADTCHVATSGSFIGRRGAANEAQVMNVYLEEVSRATGSVALLTSTEAGETSKEGTEWGYGHGVFTYFLLNGLRGEADGFSHTPQDGKVSLGELFDYVREHVIEATNAQQHPYIGSTSFDRNLVMSTAVVGATQSKPELPTSVAANISVFTGRTWLLRPLLNWIEGSNERLFLLTGSPGAGKSMIIAWLAGAGPTPMEAEARQQLEKLRTQVKAIHFCIAASGSTDPKDLARQMAKQLTRNLPGFGKALADMLGDQVQIVGEQHVGRVESGGNVTGIYVANLNLGGFSEELVFNRILRDPLKQLYADGYNEPVLLLVDALDIALTYTGGTNIVQLLAKLVDLPPQVRVLATTRPDPRVFMLFSKAQSFDLINDAPQDVDDVKQYALEQLAQAEGLDNEHITLLAAQLSQAAKGNFLYASLVLSDLQRRLPQTPELESYTLPDALRGLYHDFLNRELGSDQERWYEGFRSLLGLLAVAQSPGLTRTQLQQILGKDIEQELRICRQYLSGDLPEGPFCLFHSSFADFLLEDRENIDYHIDSVTMHRRIADYYWQTYHDDWTRCDAYGLSNLSFHLLRSNQLERFQVLELVFGSAYQLRYRVLPESGISIGSRFQLEVKLRPGPPSADAFRLPVGVSEVHCFITAEGLSVLNTNVATMHRHPETGHPMPAHFELRADFAGQSRWQVQFFADDPNSGYTHPLHKSQWISVTVNEGAERLPVLPVLDLRAAPQPHILLQVKVDVQGDKVAGRRRTYVLSYYLTSRLPLGEPPLRGNLVGTVELNEADLVRMQTLLADALSQTGGQPEEVREQLLSLGAYFFDRLFPKEKATAFRAALARIETYDKSRTSGQHLTWLVVEEGLSEVWMPWEMLVPHALTDEVGEDEAWRFLGEQYYLSRWVTGLGTPLYGEVPWGELGLADHVYAAPDDPEGRAWQRLLHPQVSAKAVTSLFNAPAGDGQDKCLLYGLHVLQRADQLVGERSIVPLPNNQTKGTQTTSNTQEEAVTDIRASIRRQRPVVGLSILAERSQQSGSSGLLPGIALSYLRAGASAVVGPWWPTVARADRIFWASFYHLLDSHVPLGEAVWRARQEVYRAAPEQLDWLAYTLFGDPRARPYWPDDSEGYTALACLNLEADGSMHPQKAYYFQASISTRPPIWHEGRLVQTETLPQRPNAIFLAPDLQESIPDPIAMTREGRYSVQATAAFTPQTEGEFYLIVRLQDGNERLQSLQLTLPVRGN